MNDQKKILISASVLVLVVLLGMTLYDSRTSVDLPTKVQEAGENILGSEENEEKDFGPLSIASMRKKNYDQGELRIEQELGDKGSFRSYIVSYLSDGLRVRALMNVPDGQMPDGGWPVLILNHGFIPPDTYSTVNSYSAFVNFYSNNGYLLIKPDYRGHDQSEGQESSAHLTPDYTADVLALIEAVKKHPSANKDRIGIWGHSMGGGISLKALVISKDIKAGVMVAGVVASPQKFYEYWERERQAGRIPDWILNTGYEILKTHKTPEENPEFWNSISPYTYIDDVSAPVSIHHGTSDDSVPIEFSEELLAATRSKNKTVEYFVYPNADHNLAGSARSLFLARSLEFLNRHLKVE